MSSRKCPVCLEPCFSEETGEQILNLYAPSCHHGVCKECIRGIMKWKAYDNTFIEDSSITEIGGKMVYSITQYGWGGKYFYKCPCCNDVSKDYTVTFGRIFYEENESSRTKVISIEQSFKKKITILKKYIYDLEQNYQSRFNELRKIATEQVRLVEEKKV